MTVLILDASVTMAWCFEKSRTPVTDAALDAIRDDRAIVPALWALEVGNVLAISERRGLIDERAIANFLALLETIPKEIHDQHLGSSFGDVLRLARMHRLTTYDAVYLELALRLRIPLATLDAPLVAAAEKAGAPLFRA